MFVLIAALLFAAGIALTFALHGRLERAGGRLGRVLALHRLARGRDFPPPGRVRFWRRLEADAREAGMDVTVRHLAWTAALIGGGTGLAIWLLTGQVWGAAVGAAAGLAAPRTWLRWRRAQQQDAYRAQIDGALLRLANHLRAGQSLIQGIAALADQVKPPLGREFHRALQASRLNVSVPDALALLGDRIALPEYEEFVLAVRLHSEAGGNLPETLERIAEQVRERRRVRAAIRAATSGSRAEALIVQATTVSMAALVPVVAPSLLDHLLQNPVGRLMGVAALVLTVAAWAIVSRCLEVPYE